MEANLAFSLNRSSSGSILVFEIVNKPAVLSLSRLVLKGLRCQELLARYNNACSLYHDTILATVSQIKPNHLVAYSIKASINEKRNDFNIGRLSFALEFKSTPVQTFHRLLSFSL